MQKVMKILLLTMLIVTAIYAGFVVYANTNSESCNGGTVYSAFLCKGEPTKWYFPEQLGITEFTEYENGVWLHVVVPYESDPGIIEHLIIMEGGAVFIYEGRFYNITGFSATPALPDRLKQWQFPLGGAIGMGWVFVGALFYKRRGRG